MNITNEHEAWDYIQVVDLVNRVATLADAREWQALEACFADEVEVDYTSLSGGKPERVSARALIQDWQLNLSGFTATQHLVGSHTLTRQSAHQITCTAYVHALHILPNPTGGATWTLAGRYEYDLMVTGDKWKIHKTKFTVLWADGNQHLTTLAQNQPMPPQI